VRDSEGWQYFVVGFAAGITVALGLFIMLIRGAQCQ
jgi:hypothetical protein